MVDLGEIFVGDYYVKRKEWSSLAISTRGTMHSLLCSLPRHSPDQIARCTQIHARALGPRLGWQRVMTITSGRLSDPPSYYLVRVNLGETSMPPIGTLTACTFSVPCSSCGLIQVPWRMEKLVYLRVEPECMMI